MRFFLLSLAAFSLTAAEIAPLAEPAPCPTRPEIAFVSGGDIWTVPSAGGDAHILVAHPATESRPIYSPDGARLAFVSNRTGNGDIYVLTIATGDVKRMTFDDAPEMLDSWSRDGKWIYFSSAAHDVSAMNDIYRVSVNGGQPLEVTADRYLNEFQAAPSPDGATLAFIARGTSNSQWWRHGHSHLDESELWTLKEGKYQRLVEEGARNNFPMWSADGRNLYFASDRSGAENLWVIAGQAKPKQLTKFTDGRLLWPTIAYDGTTAVFERNFQIWRADLKTGEAARVPVTLVGVPGGPGITHQTLNTFTALALSPDGKKIALSGHGEIFAASSKEAGEATRITNNSSIESQPQWSPDSKRVVYVSDRDGKPRLFEYDFTTAKETELTQGSERGDAGPRFSPDGKALAFIRGRKELRVIDLATKQEKLLASGVLGFAAGIAWSPDSQWIAFGVVGAKSFRNLQVVPAAGGTAKPVSFLANGGGGRVAWSPDGNYLLFDTGQRSEPGNIARVDLTPRSSPFREDQFRKLFDDAPAGAPGAAKKAAPAKVAITWEGVRERLRLLPLGLDARGPVVSPDGKQLLFDATVGGQQNLYLYSMDDMAREPVARQLTSTPGPKSSYEFSADSKEVYFLEAGKVVSMPLETRIAKPLAVTAEIDIDFNSEKKAVFAQAWTVLRDSFYDPEFHGKNWAALRGEFQPYIDGARTPDEMRRVTSLMIGELNASHSGISAPVDRAATTPVGKLGVRFDRAVYENTGKLTITEVVPNSPASVSGLKPGDTITSVMGTTVSATTNLDELLERQVNRRVELKTTDRTVVVRPIALLAEKELVYRQWVEANRQYVARVSGGKLGYVHMHDMSSEALDRLYIDLDVENQTKSGVVVDVRNNNGGFVNGYALDVFTRRGYLQLTPRDMGTAPARAQLGQRALELPTILVTNQHSLSDAEDFTEGYRALKLGKVVGEPTAGWIIYTGAAQLMDGSNLRTPATRVTTMSGEPMEGHPRPVDIAVSRPVGEGAKDSQLDVAVKELLSEIR